MKEVNDSNFEQLVLNSEKLVIVDFSAEWCGPCRTVTPIMEELSIEYVNIEVFKCDVDESSKITREYTIRNIPAVLFFKDKKVVDKQIGAVAKNIYEHKINQLL